MAHLGDSMSVNYSYKQVRYKAYADLTGQGRHQRCLRRSQDSEKILEAVMKDPWAES